MKISGRWDLLVERRGAVKREMPGEGSVERTARAKAQRQESTEHHVGSGYAEIRRERRERWLGRFTKGQNSRQGA